jgi:post-segregation antitoxin (ccd killing protein)
MGAEPPSSGTEMDGDEELEREASPQARRMLAEETRTANGIYGIIVGSAVLVSVHGSTVGQLAVAVLGTLVIYWVAERYAHVMARRIVHPEALGWSELRRELHHGWELVTASFLPLGVLVGTRALGADVSTAVVAALVCATVLLSAAGWQVGREAGLARGARFLSAVCAGAFGAGMILLKTLLH